MEWSELVEVDEINLQNRKWKNRAKEIDRK